MRTAGSIIWVLVLAACTDRAAEPVEQSVEQELPSANGTRVGNYIVVEETPPVDLPPEPACQLQDGKKIAANPMKALGTEPFWAAEVEGRCVTYKTPEDQQGTRVWTHVGTGPQGPVWNGALRGRQFQLVVKPAAPSGCSDGMSDKTYPMDAELRVDGEIRKGCAEPL